MWMPRQASRKALDERHDPRHSGNRCAAWQCTRERSARPGNDTHGARPGNDAHGARPGNGMCSPRPGNAHTARPASGHTRHPPAEPGCCRGRPRPRGPRRPAAIAAEGYRLADVVSGRFDAADAASDLLPPKRVLLPQVETPKLHKVLAQAGLGSRLEMEQLILEGRISVNNEPAHIGQRIQFGDQVKVNGKAIRYRIDPPPARV